MRRSSNTLLGRVHERTRLEARHDVEALYAFIDPFLRARLEEEREDEPEGTLAKIRTRIASVRSAEVEAVEILEARKVCQRYGGRPAALVRSLVRYDEDPVARESRAIWVRDEGVWYFAALEDGGTPGTDPMDATLRVIVMGNAGAGKTTLSRALMKGRDVARLSLDEVAFAEGAERRPLADSVADALAFIERSDEWIVEGCYADIIEPLLPHCDTLVFLNPGVETCLAHCRQRPWEPEKFDSAAAQDENLDNLLGWVAEYESRTDEYGLARHRQLFDAFPGRKFEFTRVEPDAARQIISQPDRNRDGHLWEVAHNPIFWVGPRDE